MRICIPQTFGRRGAGLGNELFPWTKSFLASHVLQAQLFHPAWGLNRREYYRYFATSRLDWLAQEIVRKALPVIRFEEADYWNTGRRDFQEAVSEFARSRELHQRRHFVFSVGGLWGGFYSIRRGRVFILAQLLKARRSVENVHAIMCQREEGKALIAVHIRRGDFRPADSVADYRGQFNVSLPIEWYMETCRSIKREMGSQVQFLLLTDAPANEVQTFIDEFRPLTSFHLKDTACSDLLLMAFSDSIVCSVSTYSMWGAFLSNTSYLWFAPSLQTHGGYGSLWGNEPSQSTPSGTTARNLQYVHKANLTFSELNWTGRGIPIDFDGAVPSSFCNGLLSNLKKQEIERDLIFYGVVRLPDSVYARNNASGTAVAG